MVLIAAILYALGVAGILGVWVALLAAAFVGAGLLVWVVEDHK